MTDVIDAALLGSAIRNLPKAKMAEVRNFIISGLYQLKFARRTAGFEFTLPQFSAIKLCHELMDNSRRPALA
jgi:hypothetical protein